MSTIQQGGFHIWERKMSVNANYCSTILLLRQLVKAGCCTQKEAVRVAMRIARQIGADINLPIS